MTFTKLLMTASATGALALGLTASADARCPDDDPCPNPYVVNHVGTANVGAGNTLGVRPVPRQNATQIRQIANGGKVLITCQTIGSKVSGTYGTTRIWNKLKHGGYVSDAWVYTGSDGNVAPACPKR